MLARDVEHQRREHDPVAVREPAVHRRRLGVHPRRYCSASMVSNRTTWFGSINPGSR